MIWEFQPGLEVFTNPGSCQDKGSRTGIFPKEGLAELVFADKAGDTNSRGATLIGLWWKSQGESRHFGNVTMHKCPLRSPVPPQASAESALLGGTWVVPVGTVFHGRQCGRATVFLCSNRGDTGNRAFFKVFKEYFMSAGWKKKEKSVKN